MNEINNVPPPEGPDENKNLTPGNNNLPKISPITAAFIGLFGGFFLYQVVGGLLTLAIFGFDIRNAPVNSLRLMTIAGQILFMLLPSLILAKVFYKDVSHVIRFYLPNWEEIFLFTIGLAILTPLMQYFISIQNHFLTVWAANSGFINTIKSFLDRLNDLVDKTYGDLLTAKSVFDGIFVVLVAAVVPAVCEEVMFRGFIQKSFEYRLKPFTAAIITAVFFGIYHFNPYALIPLIGLGLYFGFAAYKSNSIFVPMSLHFINNFLAVIFYFIFGDDDIINTAVNKSFDLSSSLMIFIGLSVLFTGTILLIKRYYSHKIKT
ncbi:MAG: type II CAAX endopeptidase family protein [Ignavibacteriaceae bacterium]|nr:type II CAAX endopeptidase family protein [Ignavibacteriaceae bacterium]